LAMREITWNPENPEIEAAVLLKAKTMTEVGRTLSNSGELSIALPENGDLIGFSAGYRRTTSVLMDGQYP
ncbi:DNA polymerase III subunit beta, partial [Staphylococcus capitis]